MKSVSLDFNQARAKHLLFKTKLRSILYGMELDHTPVLSQYECSVGKWIYNEALQEYGNIPEMLELEKVHADIHNCARELVDLYEKGRVDEARDGLPKMETIADNLISLLSAVELKLRNNEAQQPVEEYSTELLNINYQELVDLHRTIRDLDERIKNETLVSTKARRIAEANEIKFRNTVMQAPVGITILTGRNMLVEMANKTYLSIVDKTAEEFVGHSLYVSLPEVEEAVSPILINILESGEPFYGNEFPVILNRFGKREQAYFNFVYHPLHEDDGAVSGIIVVATEVTIQVQSKLALEQKDAQFRKLVSQSPIAMAILRGPNFIIEVANDALLNKIWRKDLHEVENKELLEVFPELNGQRFPGLLKNVLTNAKSYIESEAPAIVSSNDGDRKYYLDLEYSPLLELDGTASGIMVTVNDVTEKVRARQTIEVAEKRYRDLIDTLPIAVCTVDVDGYLNLYNQAATNLWGREPVNGIDKWCGSNALLALDKSMISHEDSPLAIAFKENRPITSEIFVRRPNGTLRDVVAYPQPIHDPEGNITGAMNVMFDITDRKQSETALRLGEEKFRVLANSMPQLIWTANASGELNYFSQSVYDYSGLTEKEINESGWLEIVHPQDREENIRLWTTSIVTGKPFHFEHRFRKNDGEYRWQLSRAVPQLDRDGTILMWVGTSTDIQERKLFTQGLQDLVDEQIQELKNANENLIKSNNELTQFNYVASHDLQEPLRKIQTFVSRLVELEADKLSERGKDYFDRIRKSANRTQNLIQDLLTFSHANVLEQEFAPVDLNIVLLKTEEDISELIMERGSIIKADRLPTINGIGFQMEQLFSNLLLNAIKFSKATEESLVDIHYGIVLGSAINFDDARASHDYHHIQFTDNGIGFHPQFKERIFLVFQKLHKKEAYEGTGIGLSICKKIVENHGGLITAEGRMGEGATFNVYFPIPQS